MTSFRAFATTLALVWLGAVLGGCPMTPAPPDSSAAEVGPGGSSVDTEAGAGGNGESMLAGLALELAEGDRGDDVTQSSGFDWIQTGPDYQPEDAYPPGFNPYGDDTSADGYADGGDAAAGGSGGSDGNAPGTPTGDGDGNTYSGTLDCHRHETLEGYGELSEDMTYQVTMSFDEFGVPERVPFPMFIENSLIQANVRYPGDSDTFTVPFASSAAYDVTVTVVSAVYTPETASVSLDIDVAWIGENASITASGSHTLQTAVVGDALTYSSDTHYDGDFRAADDWEGRGTEDFDCTGTLTRQ